MPPHEISRMMPPAMPAPIAAEAQSNPSSTLCTTGDAGSTDGTRGVGRGRAGARHGRGERQDREANEDQAGDAVRHLHDGLLSRRSGVNAGTVLEARYTAGRRPVYSPIDRR